MADNMSNQIMAWLKSYMVSACAAGYAVCLDSSLSSAVSVCLCCGAAGRENVLGVLLADGRQEDMTKSILLCEEMGITHKTINIRTACHELQSSLGPLSPAAAANIMPRIRTASVYALAQSRNYLVCGSLNASRRYIGTFTKWAESACDINPLADLTSDEVKELGVSLGLSNFLEWMTDESSKDKLSFTESMLNEYIQTGSCEDSTARKKILHRHQNTLHKARPVPKFKK